MLSRRRVGVFGGMFDPVHLAHIQVASRVRDELGLDAVLVVPCGNPVHRGGATASNEQRITMLSLAIASHPWLQLDTRECLSPRPSFTFDTLESLREEEGDTSWHLVMGGDAFLSLPSWKNWQQLFALAHIVVITRPGYAVDDRGMDDELRHEWREPRRPVPPRL